MDPFLTSAEIAVGCPPPLNISEIFVRLNTSLMLLPIICTEFSNWMRTNIISRSIISIILWARMEIPGTYFGSTACVIPTLLYEMLYSLRLSSKVLRSSICSFWRNGDMNLWISFISTPKEKRNSSALKSSVVTCGKDKEPVSSYMPKASIVASTGESFIF